MTGQTAPSCHSFYSIVIVPMLCAQTRVVKITRSIDYLKWKVRGYREITLVWIKRITRWAFSQPVNWKVTSCRANVPSKAVTPCTTRTRPTPNRTAISTPWDRPARGRFRASTSPRRAPRRSSSANDTSKRVSESFVYNRLWQSRGRKSPTSFVKWQPHRMRALPFPSFRACLTLAVKWQRRSCQTGNAFRKRLKL